MRLKWLCVDDGMSSGLKAYSYRTSTAEQLNHLIHSD